jgi:hypothetical protein
MAASFALQYTFDELKCNGKSMTKTKGRKIVQRIGPAGGSNPVNGARQQGHFYTKTDCGGVDHVKP